MRLLITLLFTLMLCGCGQNEVVDAPIKDNITVETYARTRHMTVYRIRAENGWIYAAYRGGMVYIKDE